MVSLVSGCAAAVVGGAAAGGYYVGKDERSVSEIASDANITTTVKAKLINDKYVKARHINVDTYRGVVTLKGHVSQSSHIQRAVSLTKSVTGVKRVIPKLAVVPD